jgi:hypothetical protein
MAQYNSLGLFFSSKSGKVGFIYPIFFAIIISMFLVQLILLVSPYEEETLVSLQRSFTISTVVNLVIISVMSAIGLFGLFKIKKIRNKTASKVLIAMFIEGGMLAILLFGKLLFISLNLESPVFLVFVAVIAYIGSYFAFLSFVDSLSRKAKNRLFVVSSGSLGSFLGLLLPFPILIAVSAILAIADTFLIQTKFFKNFLGDAKYEKTIIEMAFSTSEWGIGIGDLIGYSMIVSGASANFGLVVGGLSLLLILVGALFTMRLTVKQRQVPGLPIATALGLLPSIIALFL